MNYVETCELEEAIETLEHCVLKLPDKLGLKAAEDVTRETPDFAYARMIMLCVDMLESMERA